MEQLAVRMQPRVAKGSEASVFRPPFLVFDIVPHDHSKAVRF